MDEHRQLATEFEKLEKLASEDGQIELAALFKKFTVVQKEDSYDTEDVHKIFLKKIIKHIDIIGHEINKDTSILVSVKNQKVLRTCFQLIASFGIADCLIPGVGVNLSKRCRTAAFLPQNRLHDDEKYNVLVDCTEFFTRAYMVPVLKNIIITFHLSDYLAALIQLSFAPLKKPGIYKKFTMTEDRFKALQANREKFIKIYNNLVTNCFQPIVMKELLVLQGVTDPPPPAFVKRVVSKEMNNCLLANGGLLSLIRCFIESYNIDMGCEWKKIDIISKIVSCKHGDSSEGDYLINICAQISSILILNNLKYLTTTIACALNLKEKYPLSPAVIQLTNKMFRPFDYSNLNNEQCLPGTLVLSPQEVENNVKILHACVNTMELNCPVELILPNISLLYHLGMMCKKNPEVKLKVKQIIIKCMEACNEEQRTFQITQLLNGTSNLNYLTIEEFDAGLAIKYSNNNSKAVYSEGHVFFLELLKTSSDNNFIETAFKIALMKLLELTVQREQEPKNLTINHQEEPEILNETDQQYAIILQILSELSTSPKISSLLKKNPSSIFNFIEFFLLKSNPKHCEECITIALVLLNTILSNSNKTKELETMFINLKPALKKMCNESTFINILCKEALALMSSHKPIKVDTPYEKAVADVFNDLLPVRTHGIIELRKLIDAKDLETISKKHYLFCLFQEQLKDDDSYVYLSAINAIASLGTHCTEDVLQLLCNEFLQLPSEKKELFTLENQIKDVELRMKIGDVIVKVTKRLGDMTIKHKTLLLNTMLCACADDEPLLRASALSNLAEIALVLHFRIGTIIYEILNVVWNIIETDKAIECRRAAVMVISSLLKGLGKETLLQLKENLLPIYRTLKKLYSDESEDSIVRLHSQIALEELNDIVKQFLFSEVNTEKRIFVLDKPENIFK